MSMLSFALVHEIDIAAGRRLYGLDDLSDDDVVNVMRHQCRQLPEATTDEPGAHLQRLNAIILLHYRDGEFRFERLCLAGSAEGEQLAYFLAQLATCQHLVTCSRQHVSSELLRYRALLHGLPFTPAWNQCIYTDLAEAAGGAFDEMACLYGFPDRQRLRRRSGLTESRMLEWDVLTQCLFAWRLQMIDGELAVSDYRRRSDGLRDFLRRSTAAHRQDYLQVWHDGF